jgi:hypothetical protein
VRSVQHGMGGQAHQHGEVQQRRNEEALALA